MKLISGQIDVRGRAPQQKAESIPEAPLRSPRKDRRLRSESARTGGDPAAPIFFHCVALYDGLPGCHVFGFVPEDPGILHQHVTERVITASFLLVSDDIFFTYVFSFYDDVIHNLLEGLSIIQDHLLLRLSRLQYLDVHEAFILLKYLNG